MHTNTLTYNKKSVLIRKQFANMGGNADLYIFYVRVEMKLGKSDLNIKIDCTSCNRLKFFCGTSFRWFKSLEDVFRETSICVLF